MNPWKRRETRVRLANEGAPYAHPAYPEWRFFIRPADAWNAELAIAARRVAARSEFSSYYRRRAAAGDGFKPTDADRKLESRILLTTFIEGCVASWEGVTSPDGEPLAFRAAAVRDVFAAFPEISEGAMNFATNAANFIPRTPEEKTDIAAGN